jgi:hypothetical protein
VVVVDLRIDRTSAEAVVVVRLWRDNPGHIRARIVEVDLERTVERRASSVGTENIVEAIADAICHFASGDPERRPTPPDRRDAARDSSGTLA